MLFNNNLQKCKKELEKLYLSVQDVEDKYDEAMSLGKNDEAEELKQVIRERTAKIDEFIETVYAAEVFEKYKKKRPDLIRIKTGEVVAWEDAFGMDYNKISNSLRHSLVGLIDGSGKYKLK